MGVYYLQADPGVVELLLGYLFYKPGTVGVAFAADPDVYDRGWLLVRAF